MRIFLIKPHNISDHIQPSLGLGYLAAAVRKSNQVRILDCIKENVRLERLSSYIEHFKPDLVGLQCYTFDLKFVKEALGVIKGIDKDIITVIGGPHPSAMPVETMGYMGSNLDYSFTGEAETGFNKFIESLKSNSPDLVRIPGLVYRTNGEIKCNPNYHEQNLDLFGLPAWDLINPQTYPQAQHGAFFRKFPIAPIIITRGCPYQCTFCAGKVITGERIRKRSIESVINEIRLLYTDYGIREFHIIDDNFTQDKTYAKALLRELLRQDLDISWATPNGIRMETLDEELIKLMKESGLYLISLGIESGSDRVLQSMRKNITVKEIRERVGFIRKHGIDIAGFFIMGFPGETKEEIKQTMRLSLELDLIRVNFFTFLPFPGTESYRQLDKKGELGVVDWDNFYFMNAAYVPKGISRRELKWLQRIAFFRFFLRPRVLWKNLIQIRSPQHFVFLFKRAVRWIMMG